MTMRRLLFGASRFAPPGGSFLGLLDVRTHPALITAKALRVIASSDGVASCAAVARLMMSACGVIRHSLIAG
jgi:hypothetical protein